MKYIIGIPLPDVYKENYQLSLSEPGTFGSAVTFLSVEMSNIIDLHRRLVHAISPSQELLDRYFEMDKYHPHLTLGQTYWGLNETEIEEMKLLAILFAYIKKLNQTNTCHL